jgi:hypothetical protein
LALVLFVFCLTAIMLLAEECKSLSFHLEEEKDDCHLSNQFLIPTVAASVMPLGAIALTFVEGRVLTGALHFNGAFMIPFLYGLSSIIIHRSMRQYQLQDLAISTISILPPQVLLGAETCYALLDKKLSKICHGLQTQREDVFTLCMYHI